MKDLLKNYTELFPIIFILLVTVFFSTYKLGESPRTWMDEGIITQVAINIAEEDRHALQVAPGTFVSAGVVSTGYPVTFPISIFFRFFGVGLIQARSVMVIFIVSLVLLAFFYLKRNYDSRVAFWGALVIATFSPLYGQGKNVLGEVPGLVFLLAMLYIVDQIENDNKRWYNFVALGVLAGLLFSTKSIFILIVPVLFFVYIVSSYMNRVSWSKNYLLSIFIFILMVLFWFFVQFDDDSLGHILSIYVNPHSTDSLQSVINNLGLFFTELQPMYFAFTMMIWGLAVFLRVKNGSRIITSELISFYFSVLVFLAFFRTAGFYRYFFLAQFLSLVYLFPSITYIIKKNNLYRYAVPFIGLLVIFHTYQTSHNSWVASYYNGQRSANIERYSAGISTGKILLYQVPEFVVFLKSSEYYQFIDIAPLIKVGAENKGLLENGYFDKVIINSSLYNINDQLFSKYRKIDGFDSYLILEKYK